MSKSGIKIKIVLFMLKLNKKIEYSLIALRYLQENEDEPVSAKIICQKNHISFDVLSQSLQCLTRDGILNSIKGSKGGYKIDRDLKQISLLNLWESLEGEQTIVECLSGEHHCSLTNSCNMISPMKKLNKQMRNFLDDISISELLI